MKSKDAISRCPRCSGLLLYKPSSSSLAYSHFRCRDCGTEVDFSREDVDNGCDVVRLIEGDVDDEDNRNDPFDTRRQHES